jgi:hypothetical protein
MNHTRCYPSMTRYLLLAGLLLMGSVAPALAADIVGDWNMTMEFNGNQSLATLSITQNPDGSYSGMWGGSKLSNIKLQGDKLTFDRTIRFGDNEFTMSYAGTVQGGKLTGQWSSDRGEFETNGVKTKPMSPAAGVWDLTYSVGDREMTGKLTITQKPDGALAGKWTSQRGESDVSNVQFQGGKLTFDRTVKFNDQEFQMAFAGTVQDGKLTGEFKSDRGEVPVTGTRAGGALIGKWLLTAVSERGERTLLMTVNPDLTGRYEFFFGELPMKDLKIEGNQVTFALESSFGDQTMQMNFKGTIENGVLKGQMTSERGTTEITGKKLPPAAAPAAGAAVAGAGIVGTWEFTRETQQGTRTSTLTIKPDMTGTYKMRDTEVPVTDLKVQGDQVSFKVTMTFGGNEVPMEFKGKLEGATLKGEFTTSRGTREAVGKKVQ